jgi:hypothetical protein
MRGGIFIQKGLPMVLVTVGGWLSLSHFVQSRIDIQEARQLYVDDHSPVEKQRAKRFNLDEEVERIKKQHLEHDYDNKSVGK